ncbi:Arylamine N-acetyltransferase [Penicillium crustosum]|uniref:Arylamine N-acetyltransferase n=1 Tax=Penicillium crustosum TaxID=36656 RepID=UPI0023A6DCF1|nr:Arylamine N-acetyltransferase [Penicillium crustosum]KAJ5410913.1 Arylamine N-acetyltransferase [Penicillium crustosum]
MHYITKSRRLNGETRAHIVNIVRLSSGVQYRLDVAFGGDGPTSPLLLISGQYGYTIIAMLRISCGIPTIRLRNWSFVQHDFEVMNRFTSWETVEKHNFVVVKFIRNGETAGLPLLKSEMLENTNDVFVVGKIMMVNGVVKLNMGGRTRVIDSFET